MRYRQARHDQSCAYKGEYMSSMESNHQVPLIHSQRVWPDCIGGNSTKRPVPSRSFLWEVARKFRSSLTRHFPNVLQFAANLDASHHQWRKFLSAAIRQPRFNDLAVVGSPFSQNCRHPHTPLLSFPPSRQFPRSTPERGFGVDHQSRPRFSGTRFSTRRPRLIGT